MKKILAILAMATISSGVFAATAQLEYQDWDGTKGTASSQEAKLTVKEQINKNFAGDVAFSQTWKDNNGGLSSRMETGLTGTYPVAGISLYTRAAVGEKFTNTSNFGYYSVEPGVIAPIGTTGLTAKVGYRFRTAFNDVNVNNDTTRTWRAGLSYDLTKKDTIGVRYDRTRGDTNANGIAVSYTRGF
jgi:hypothetical protein